MDIGNGEVNSADVKDQSLTTFDVSTFLGADVVDNTLTGADVDESTLNLAAEPWHEVGSAGQPAFTGGSLFLCDWTNFNDSFNSAAFLRDRFGIVHLKGMVTSHLPTSGTSAGPLKTRSSSRSPPATGRHGTRCTRHSRTTHSVGSTLILPAPCPSMSRQPSTTPDSGSRSTGSASAAHHPARTAAHRTPG